MLWKFGSIYNTERLLADHARPVCHAIRLPDVAAPVVGRPSPAQLYVHHPTAVAADAAT
jgi:magnesium-protoporphyrin IX monomethyl ester (oxidative) cyclase